MAPVVRAPGLTEASGVRSGDAGVVIWNAADCRNFIFHSIKVNVAIVGVLSNVDITAFSIAIQFEFKFGSMGTAAWMGPHLNEVKLLIALLRFLDLPHSL